MAIKHWILATRPKTLPAAIIPVIVGSSLAIKFDTFAQGEFSNQAFTLCLAFAILVQIGTNFANDYFDFLKGADTNKRKGPTRMVASGHISPKAMKIATALTLFIAFTLGLSLVKFGGPWLILVGVASIISAVIYTGGPYPLAYNGLGDIFVIFFFGVIAVSITFYVQTGVITTESILTGTAIGLLINNLLVVNNYRDIEEDKLANKKTLIVKFGKPFGFKMYQTSLILATIGLPVYFHFVMETNIWPVTLALPYGINVLIKMKKADSIQSFGNALSGTVKVFISVGLLISLSLYY